MKLISRSFVVVCSGLLLSCAGTTSQKTQTPEPEQIKVIRTPSNVEVPKEEKKEKSGLQYTEQSGWVSETPKTSMRLAQWRLPGKEGKESDASLVVYYFGGGGGSVEDNFLRWYGQFEQPDGKSSDDVAVLGEKEVEGMMIYLVDLGGTYIAETQPGSGKRLYEENYRLLGAIVESPYGPYFIKLIGPRKTVESWKKSFQKFLDELRP